MGDPAPRSSGGVELVASEMREWLVSQVVNPKIETRRGEWAPKVER
jgi:hypothetical protein